MLVPSVESDLYRDDLTRLLRAALTLQQFQVIVLLFGLDGGTASYKDAARALHCSTDVIKERRREALKRLKQRPDILALLRESIPTARTMGVIHVTSPQ